MERPRGSLPRHDRRHPEEDVVEQGQHLHLEGASRGQHELRARHDVDNVHHSHRQARRAVLAHLEGGQPVVEDVDCRVAEDRHGRPVRQAGDEVGYEVLALACSVLRGLHHCVLDPVRDLLDGVAVHHQLHGRLHEPLLRAGGAGAEEDELDLPHRQIGLLEALEDGLPVVLRVAARCLDVQQPVVQQRRGRRRGRARGGPPPLLLGGVLLRLPPSEVALHHPELRGHDQVGACRSTSSPATSRGV